MNNNLNIKDDLELENKRKKEQKLQQTPQYKMGNVKTLEEDLIQKKLFKAIITGNIQEVDAMIKAGADINAMDDFGNTPLHCAAGNTHPGSSKMIALLVANHAKIDAVNSFGETPVLVAYKNKNFFEARELAKSGANMQLSDHSGVSVMTAIAKHGNVQEYRFAKENGLQPQVSHFGMNTYQKMASIKRSHDRADYGQGQDQAVSLAIPQTMAAKRDDFELAEAMKSDMVLVLREVNHDINKQDRLKQKETISV